MSCVHASDELGDILKKSTMYPFKSVSSSNIDSKGGCQSAPTSCLHASTRSSNVVFAVLNFSTNGTSPFPNILPCVCRPPIKIPCYLQGCENVLPLVHIESPRKHLIRNAAYEMLRAKFIITIAMLEKLVCLYGDKYEPVGCQYRASHSTNVVVTLYRKILIAVHYANLVDRRN